MAAVIRSGATRLAGSALLQRAPAAGAVLQPKPAASAMLQRTQASGVDALRRPFLPRFMSTTKQQHAYEIEERKEELFDLIALTESSLHTDYHNRLLLREISAQVQPRPAVPKWRSMRAAKRVNNVMRPVGIGAGLVLGCASLTLLLISEEVSQDILKEQKEEKRKAAKEKKLAKEKQLAFSSARTKDVRCQPVSQAALCY